MVRDERADRPKERIVAVGLLTAHDLDVLGSGFKRVFPVDDDASFDDILTRIDALTLGETIPTPMPRR